MRTRFTLFALILGTAVIIPAYADDHHDRHSRENSRWRQYDDGYRYNDNYRNNSPYYANNPYYGYNGQLTAKQQREYYKEQRKLEHEREKAIREQQREAWKAQRDAARYGYSDPRYYGYPRR